MLERPWFVAGVVDATHDGCGPTFRLSVTVLTGPALQA